MVEKIKSESNVPKLIETADYAVLYACLNGKSESCIHGRTIPSDRIVCALDKAFRINSSQIIKRLNEISAVDETPQVQPVREIYIERFAVVRDVEEHFSVNL